MQYSFFPQEKPNWCVPACLQSILKRRGLEVISQEKIFSFFKNDHKGVILNEENLNFFLEKYNLKSKYTHPRTSFPEMDFVLEESLKQKKDILTAFHYDKNNRHVTLLINMKFPDIFLHDPSKKINQITLTNLFNLMPLDGECGFYLIS